MSLLAGLNNVLPAPKHHSDTTSSTPSTRILGASDAERQQLVLRQTGPPPYGSRSSWRPRSQEDYADGGAFPEIPIAQYPLDMGRKGGRTSKSKALALQVDAEGKVKYDAIAKQGHGAGRVVHASFKDLIPLRQRADVGEISLERPSEEDVKATAERTKAALEKLVSGAVAAQKPKTVKGNEKREAQYVRYTPSSQMGDTSKKSDRIIKIIEKQQDPMEPPKFKHRKIPRGPPSPPPPVMHSPPRKLTAADQEAWTIPPPVSNWKNPGGYTVPLDKRLAADGRGMQDVTINDKFAQLSEALYTADRHAREEVKQRALMQQKLAEKEKEAKEEHVRQLAQKAREEANARVRGRRRSSIRSPSVASSRSRSRSPSSRRRGRSYSTSRSRSASSGRAPRRRARSYSTSRSRSASYSRSRSISSKRASRRRDRSYSTSRSRSASYSRSRSVSSDRAARRRGRSYSTSRSRSYSRSRRSVSSSRSRSRGKSYSISRSRSRGRRAHSSRSRSSSASSDDSAVRERERMRRERRAEDQRELRMKRMGQERKMQMLAREQGRDISEKVALGLAKPTATKESMFDSRLFNQGSSFAAGSGFNEDNPYDKPLFAAAEAANSIYRPNVQMDDDEDMAENEMERIKRSSRFEVLGKAQKGFKGTEEAERDGPVMFEKDKPDVADPFGVEAFVKSVGDEVGSRKHGLQVQGGERSKRPRRGD